MGHLRVTWARRLLDNFHISGYLDPSPQRHQNQEIAIADLIRIEMAWVKTPE